MYLVYADESGDPGLKPGPAKFFVISGIIVHESDWNEVFQQIVDLRRWLSVAFDLPQRVTWHATDIVNQHGEFHHSRHAMTPEKCFLFYENVLEALAQLTQLRVLNVCIRKDRLPTTDPPPDIFELGWSRFIQRFHNFLDHGGIRESKEWGVLITDRTHDDALRRLLRKMRAFNPVPSQFLPGTRPVLVNRILDDPVARNSAHSYFIQAADMIAFALARRDYPRPALTRYGFEKMFNTLDPILLKAASSYDRQGIVYWPR